MNIALRNKVLNDFGTAIGTGTLTIYSGTPPANDDAALSGNTALAAHAGAGFAAAASGSMSANAISPDAIDATGRASFARWVSGSYVQQLTVGIEGSGAQLIVAKKGAVPDVTDLDYVTGGQSIIASVTITKGA